MQAYTRTMTHRNKIIATYCNIFDQMVALRHGLCRSGISTLGERVIQGQPHDANVHGSFLPLSVVFSFVFTFTFIFVPHVGRLVGGQTLLDLALGRYHN